MLSCEVAKENKGKTMNIVRQNHDEATRVTSKKSWFRPELVTDKRHVLILLLAHQYIEGNSNVGSYAIRICFT